MSLPASSYLIFEDFTHEQELVQPNSDYQLTRNINAINVQLNVMKVRVEKVEEKRRKKEKKEREDRKEKRKENRKEKRREGRKRKGREERKREGREEE